MKNIRTSGIQRSDTRITSTDGFDRYFMQIVSTKKSVVFFSENHLKIHQKFPSKSILKICRTYRYSNLHFLVTWVLSCGRHKVWGFPSSNCCIFTWKTTFFHFTWEKLTQFSGPFHLVWSLRREILLTSNFGLLPVVASLLLPSNMVFLREVILMSYSHCFPLVNFTWQNGQKLIVLLIFLNKTQYLNIKLNNLTIF